MSTPEYISIMSNSTVNYVEFGRKSCDLGVLLGTTTKSGSVSLIKLCKPDLNLSKLVRDFPII